MKPLDVAIVGAGPAGLATALYLKREGHRPVIFERFESVAPVGSGLMLQPTGLTVLDDLGLLQELLALGHTIYRLVGTEASTRRPVLDVRYDALGRGRFGLAVNRSALFDVLYRAVLKSGIEVRTGSTVESVECDRSGVDLRQSSDSSLGRFDLAVDSSGSRSRLRQFAKHPVEPKALVYGALWSTLDWNSDGFEAHALTQRYNRASVMIGVLPTGKMRAGGGEKVAFFWSIKPADYDAIRSEGIDAWKSGVLEHWPECSVYLDQITTFEDMTLAIYGHHTLKIPAGERIAFVGDSAHSTSPQLGQGANMALLDARALSNALAISSDVASALEAYAQSRRWHVRVFQALSMAFTPFYQSDSAALAYIRDEIVSRIAPIPPGPKVLASMVSGTLIDPFAPLGLVETDWSTA